MATYSSIFAGEFQGQRSLTSYRPWGRKEWDMTEGLTFSLPLYHTGIIILKNCLMCGYSYYGS